MRSSIAWLRSRLTALALCGWLCAGCSGGGMGEGLSLISPNPARKIPAIKTAVEENDLARAAAPLVRSLDSSDAAERFYAIQGLEKLTGETFGYIYYESAPARRPAIEQWQQWLNDRERDRP